MDDKERDPYEAELYWNWQPGDIQIDKWPDGWKVIPPPEKDSDEGYETPNPLNLSE